MKKYRFLCARTHPGGSAASVRALGSWTILPVWLSLGFIPAHARGQAFDCVLLNDDNTNIFTIPDECFTLPENATWCNCVRSLLTNPVKGEKSGFNQAIQWIVKPLPFKFLIDKVIHVGQDNKGRRDKPGTLSVTT